MQVSFGMRLENEASASDEIFHSIMDAKVFPTTGFFRHRQTLHIFLAPLSQCRTFESPTIRLDDEVHLE